MSILVALGDHKFTVNALNFQKLQEEYAARWKEHFTANGGHVDHFLGATPDVVTISGVLFPAAYGGHEQARAVGASIRAGKPLPLYSLTGANFGEVKILSLRLSSDKIGPSGIIIEASYELKVSGYSGQEQRNELLKPTNENNSRTNFIETLF